MIQQNANKGFCQCATKESSCCPKWQKARNRTAAIAQVMALTG